MTQHIEDRKDANPVELRAECRRLRAALAEAQEIAGRNIAAAARADRVLALERQAHLETKSRLKEEIEALKSRVQFDRGAVAQKLYERCTAGCWATENELIKETWHGFAEVCMSALHPALAPLEVQAGQIIRRCRICGAEFFTAKHCLKCRGTLYPVGVVVSADTCTAELEVKGILAPSAPAYVDAARERYEGLRSQL